MDVIGKFDGVPIVEIPQEGDKLIVLQFDMEKHDLDQCISLFKQLQDELPHRTLLALPQTCNLTELDDAELEEIIDCARKAMYDSYCDWCQGGAADLVYGLTGYGGDIDEETGMMTIYNCDKEVASRKVNYCPMCGRPVGRFAPTEKQ